jgi:hypothetical protein
MIFFCYIVYKLRLDSLGGKGGGEGERILKTYHIVIIGPKVGGKHHIMMALNYPRAVGFGILRL